MNPGYLATSGWIASAVGAAAALGIADRLGDGTMSAAELAATTGSSEEALRLTLRLLVQVGVFAEDGSGHFSNTADSHLLRSDHPQSLRYFCQLAAGDYQRVFFALPHVVKTGEPATTRVFGESIYSYMDRVPASAEIYDRAMEDLSRTFAAAFAANRDFSRARLVLDVGGGRGTLAKALLKAHPHLRGMVADRASVCARAEAELRQTDGELASRLQYVPVNFFVEVPAGADVYFLKNVLHNLGDDSVLQLLRTLASAMHSTPDARLIVIEPNKLPPLHQALDELLQMVLCEKGSAGRTVDDHRRLLTAAGLEIARADLDHAGMGVLEARVKR